MARPSSILASRGQSGPCLPDENETCALDVAFDLFPTASAIPCHCPVQRHSLQTPALLCERPQRGLDSARTRATHRFLYRLPSSLLITPPDFCPPQRHIYIYTPSCSLGSLCRCIFVSNMSKKVPVTRPRPIGTAPTSAFPSAS
jgi:hypothetical protein